jgi:hypothetical protein
MNFDLNFDDLTLFSDNPSQDLENRSNNHGISMDISRSEKPCSMDARNSSVLSPEKFLDTLLSDIKPLDQKMRKSSLIEQSSVDKDQLSGYFSTVNSDNELNSNSVS